MMSFKRSVLFMIREKYPNLDLSDIDLTEMRGWDKHDPIDGFDRQKDQDIEGDATANLCRRKGKFKRRKCRF